MTEFQLDDLPDEVILNILSFLKIKLIKCQVSKRLRAIVNDESLWLKLNLYYRKVPYDFIEKAAGNGCQYLSLAGCDMIGMTGKSKSSLNLKYLSMYYNSQGVQKLVQNCSALQKLSLAGLTLNWDDIQYICQNSQTLEVLDLQGCKINLCYQTELVQDLFTNCAHLTELNIGTYSIISCDTLLDPHIHALVDNLTRTILKVNLRGQDNLQDEHVKKLIKRCNNITHLDLSGTSITNDSMHSIIEHLKTSLEELNVCETDVDYFTLFQLKSMPALKALICFNPYHEEYDDHAEDIENLKQQLPHIRIIEEKNLHIAKPFKMVNGWDDKDWIWEISAKQQDLFATR